MAVINEAWYEWAHHAPLAKAGGVTEEGMKTLEVGDLRSKNAGEGLSEKQWAVVKYTDAMTKDVSVPEEVFAELKKQFSEQEVVEITAVVSLVYRYSGITNTNEGQAACYNCVSRFLVALDGKFPFSPKSKETNRISW